MILDWDVHHGNGTQAIFYEDPSGADMRQQLPESFMHPWNAALLRAPLPSCATARACQCCPQAPASSCPGVLAGLCLAVLFIDLHQDEVWPGTGGAEESGAGEGEGTTVNVPLPLHSGQVAAQRAFERVVVPAARRFGPELIIVSAGGRRAPPASYPPGLPVLFGSANTWSSSCTARPRNMLIWACPCMRMKLPARAICPLTVHDLSAGYDAHWQDPLEQLQLQSATYHWLGAAVRQLAAELCGGRLLLLLEGGYVCRGAGGRLALQGSCSRLHAALPALLLLHA